MGLVGMKNMGNTCYMNACIQCLSHTFELSSVFMKITGQDINRSSQSKGLIATEFANLIRTVWAERPRSVFEPARLKKQIGKLNETFAGFAQQDSQELLRFLLDGAPQPQPVLCPPAWGVWFFYSLDELGVWLLCAGLHEDLNRIRQKPPWYELEDIDGESDTAKAARFWDYNIKRNSSPVRAPPAPSDTCAGADR